MYEELYFIFLFLVCSIPLGLLLIYYYVQHERDQSKRIRELEEKLETRRKRNN